MTQTITIPTNKKQLILQDEPGSRTIVLEANAEIEYILSFKDEPETPETIAQKSIIQFELKGDNSKVQIYGLFAGKNKDQVKFETRTIHSGNSTTAHTNVKTLLRDEAKSDYFGLIRIEKNTTGNDGQLSHDTMLLSKQAKSKSVPALEIEANDVKAGHSASVGQVDEEALFYLRARGLTEEQARELMIEGFFEEILMQISDTQIANTLRENLKKSLE